jgi:hypothetical protein
VWKFDVEVDHGLHDHGLHDRRGVTRVVDGGAG